MAQRGVDQHAAAGKGRVQVAVVGEAHHAEAGQARAGVEGHQQPAVGLNEHGCGTVGGIGQADDGPAIGAEAVVRCAIGVQPNEADVQPGLAGHDQLAIRLQRHGASDVIVATHRDQRPAAVAEAFVQTAIGVQANHAEVAVAAAQITEAAHQQLAVGLLQHRVGLVGIGADREHQLAALTEARIQRAVSQESGDGEIRLVPAVTGHDQSAVRLHEDAAGEVGTQADLRADDATGAEPVIDLPVGEQPDQFEADGRGRADVLGRGRHQLAVGLLYQAAPRGVRATGQQRHAGSGPRVERGVGVGGGQMVRPAAVQPGGVQGVGAGGAQASVVCDAEVKVPCVPALVRPMHGGTGGPGPGIEPAGTGRTLCAPAAIQPDLGIVGQRGRDDGHGRRGLLQGPGIQPLVAQQHAAGGAVPQHMQAAQLTVPAGCLRHLAQGVAMGVNEADLRVLRQPLEQCRQVGQSGICQHQVADASKFQALRAGHGRVPLDESERRQPGATCNSVSSRPILSKPTGGHNSLNDEERGEQTTHLGVSGARRPLISRAR